MKPRDKPAAAPHPSEPDRPVVLYDGRCPFCTSQARRLRRWSRDRLDIRSFHDDGVLAEFPALTVQDCMTEMKFIDRDNRIFGGAQALMNAVAAGRPALRGLPRLVGFRPLRWAADRLYSWVAGNRYRLFARKASKRPKGTCPRHAGESSADRSG